MFLGKKRQDVQPYGMQTVDGACLISHIFVLPPGWMKHTSGINASGSFFHTINRRVNAEHVI